MYTLSMYAKLTPLVKYKYTKYEVYIYTLSNFVDYWCMYCRVVKLILLLNSDLYELFNKVYKTNVDQ